MPIRAPSGSSEEWGYWLNVSPTKHNCPLAYSVPM